MRCGRFLFLFLLLEVIGQQTVRADEEYISRPSFQEGECNRQRAEEAAEKAYGWTSLTLAVLYNDPSRVKELLDRGGNINTTDTLNRSLLLLALKHNLDGMGRLLIERGANVNLLMAARRNHRTWVSNTPLAVALRQKNFEIAKVLLQKGATPPWRPATKISPAGPWFNGPRR
ncbi:MAG TPA: ankyrin repeat domain-containing protein [Candidatus Sumerlaeota bacterium]|nr:ankyrin repeat domain-containing protein [Candidatus Sumerlaeota bacterium]HPS01247.1 ankyrin repeat domain-containing protein [Candidatus Sumerlaeota bacterium]